MKLLKDNSKIEAFGKNLKKVRESKNVTQEQLAFSIGLEISQISRIERGVINTSISNVFIIAKSLNIHPKELFDFELD